MGYDPVQAGRFHGFGNLGFAVFATAALLAAAGVAHWRLGRDDRRGAVALVLTIGVIAVAVDGWPGWGADFGGVIALVPGFAVLALRTAGTRLSLRTLGLVVACGVTAVAVLAGVDFMRSQDERTHFGQFVAQAVDGTAWRVILRKIGGNLAVLTQSVVGPLVSVAVILAAVVLRRPSRWRPAALDDAFTRAPSLRNGLTAVLVTAVVGFAVNDSGVAVPALALALAVPLTLAVSLHEPDADETPVPATGEPARVAAGGQARAPGRDVQP